MTLGTLGHGARAHDHQITTFDAGTASSAWEDDSCSDT